MKMMLKRAVAVMLTAVIILCAAPVAGLNAAAADYTYIQYGNYPQSRETNSSVISELNSKAGSTDGWTSYGYYSGTGNESDGQMTAKDYMRYKDVVYNGAKYRGVYFSSYRPYCTGYTSSASNSHQDENGYSTGTKYWFKYEPLTWRVLDSATGLIMCENNIDSQAYNNYELYSEGYYYGDASKTYYANNYYYSSIRQWLNDDFYNTAFNQAQKNNIEKTELDNSCYVPSYAQYNAPSSNDKIFLLSYNDAMNASYGFASEPSNDTARRAMWSDYALCQGLENLILSYNCSAWWLRSSKDGSHSACLLDDNGSFDDYDYSHVCHTNKGIRPASRLSNLKSDISQSGISDFNFSQTHTVDAYRSANAEYKNKYFAGAGVPLDGSNGSPDLCIPGLSAADHFVPQGLGYDSVTGTVFTTSYKYNDDGNSMLFTLDGSTGDMTGEYFLNDATHDVVKSHVGGVAAYNNTVYIANDDSILTYSTANLDGGTGLIATGSYPISDKLNGAKCSYVTISDGVLWTGNFYDAEDSRYNQKASAAYNSVILGFDLKNGTDFSKADYTVWVDNKIENIQSAVCDNGTWYLTSSFGRQNDSTLYFGNPHNSTYLRATELTPVRALPMMENGFIKDGYLYAMFESAAYKYHGAEDTVSRDPTDVIWKIDLEQMKRNAFVIGRDSNGFTHNNESGDGFEGSKNYKISDSYFNLLTRNSNAVEKTYVKFRMNQKWGGSCYGVSATMSMLKNKQITPSDLTNKSVLDYHSIGKPSDDTKFRDVINYYQLSQFIGKGGDKDATIRKFYPGTLDAVNLVTGNSIKDTLRKIVECANENKLYVLTFQQPLYGHAVVLVDSTYVNGEYVVRYFDLNSEYGMTTYNSTDYNYMYINKDFTHYTLSDLSFMYDTAIVNLVDPAKMISLNPYSAKSYAPAKTRAAEESHTQFYIVPDCAFKLTNAEGQALVYDGESFSGDMKVYDLNVVVQDERPEYVFDIANSDSFILDCAESVAFSLVNGQDVSAVEGSNISNIKVSGDNIEITGEDIDFTAFVSTDELVAENESGLVSVSAKSTESVTITRNNDRVEVTSDGKMSDIEASSYVGTEKETQTYNGKTDEITVTPGEENLIETKIVHDVSIGDVTIDYRGSTTIKPQITADEGAKYTVKYESSNPKVATVDDNGNVYGAKKGTAEIKVTVTDENGNTVTDTCKVTVKYTGLQWFIIIVLFGWIWYLK